MSTLANRKSVSSLCETLAAGAFSELLLDDPVVAWVLPELSEHPTSDMQLDTNAADIAKLSFPNIEPLS